MPAIGNIAILDAKTTPVTHTFAPVSTNGSLGELANRAASIPSGFETLKLEVTKPVSNTAAYRVKVKLTLPTVAAVDGSDTVVRVSSFDGVVNFSQASTAQERKDAAKLLSNLFNHATFVTVVENLEPLY